MLSCPPFCNDGVLLSLDKELNNDTEPGSSGFIQLFVLK